MTDRRTIKVYVTFVKGQDDLVEVVEDHRTQDSDVLYMALAVLDTATKHGNNPEVKALAQRIYNAAIAEHDRNYS